MGKEIDLLRNYPKAKRDLHKRLEQKNEFVRNVARKFEKEFFEAINELVFNQEESLTRKKIELPQSEIEKLSPRCKKTFILSKKEGLTYIEIADYLEISTKTVENNMIKAFFNSAKKMKEKFNTLILLLFIDRNKIS